MTRRYMTSIEAVVAMFACVVPVKYAREKRDDKKPNSYVHRLDLHTKGDLSFDTERQLMEILELANCRLVHTYKYDQIFQCVTWFVKERE